MPDRNDAAQNIMNESEKEAELIDTKNDTNTNKNELKTQIYLIDTPTNIDELKKTLYKRERF